MTGFIVAALAAILLIAIGSVYSRFLSRSFGEDTARPTPAILKNDGRDYVPTPTPVVFGHHFASIAGAGPIVGPVLALCWGWGPAIAWVLVGGLFIGAVHDYLAAFMSMREEGQSVAVIARRLLGRGPFIALMIFLILLLALVTAVFLNTSAAALVSMLDLGRMRLADGQTLFRVVDVGGQQKVVIGGIASMSVIIITLFSPLVGWMYIKKQVAVWKCSLLAIAICAISILVGLYFPVALPETVGWLNNLKGTDFWKILLTLYVLIAAGAPVWMFLQSRDFINVHILYAGVILLMLTLVVASLRAGSGTAVGLPVFDATAGQHYLGLFWPSIFITIACGAVSGFHSLCAGGTTCKQLTSEKATRHIGYWGMILETFLAVTVIGVLMVGTTQANYLGDVFPLNKDQNPVLGFAAAVGAAAHIAFGLPVAAGALAGMLLLEGFVITTLDTAVRLNRYLIEEVWQELFKRENGGPPKILRYYWVNSGIAVGLMLYLSMSGRILQLWKIFGASNQLLAAFVLGIGTIWLLRRGRRVWYIVAPALFMLVTTIASLVMLLSQYFPRIRDGRATGNPTLFVADLVLLALTCYLVATGIIEVIRCLRRPTVAVPVA